MGLTSHLKISFCMYILYGVSLTRALCFGVSELLGYIVVATGDLIHYW